MKKYVNLAIVTALVLSSTFVEAKTIPRERREDSRIREVWYNETQVVEIGTSFGFATTVEFGNESVKTIVAGDTIG